VFKNNLARIFGTFVVLSLAPAVYTAEKFPDYPVRPAGDYAVTAEKAGLTIGVQPVEDLKDQKTYFDAELTPKGFIPVFIVMQNGSNGDSFLFDKTGVTYGAVGAADSALSDPDVRKRRGTGSTILEVGGGLAGLAAAHRIAKAGDEQINIMKKELYSGTLSAGTSAHGFLYLPVPKDAPRPKICLRVPITKASTGETSVIELVF
jgi:hypothetical protein